MKKLLQDIIYYTLFGIWYVVSHLPLTVLYVFSSGMAALLYHVIRYRRKMVHRNMRDSFPDMSEQELAKTEKAFYLHFCDILMESVKYFSISEKELRRRMKVVVPPVMMDDLKNGRSCGIYLGHFCNWEWISSMPLWIPSDTALTLQLYHPLENKIFDRIISYTRERFGGKNIPVNESLRHLINYSKQGKPVVVGFIADQVPFWNNIHYWTPFLNHPDTPVFSGPERIMKKLDMCVYYLDVRKTARGHYEMEYKLMTQHPKACGEFELTESYTRLLEQSIIQSPAYWLWSHNRWKRTKQEWLKMYNPETGKVIMG